MRNLRFRRAARTSVLGTAALITALSLTACQEGGQAAADATTTAPDASDTQPPADTEAPAAQDGGAAGSGSGEDSASDAGKASGTGSTKADPAADTQQDDAKDTGPVTRACDGGNSKVTLTPVPRPLNHMLLTVTNTGSTACNAYYYPFLRFGEAQSTPPVVEESKPQAVVTILPGESAYAGVMTSSADGSGTGGYSTKKATVHFQGRDGSGSSGPSASAPLSKAVYVDSTLTVTYWQTEMDYALMH
ncbi:MULTISPECIES: DUF4232 domain-containing protein [Streptomyces]|uniref:DUF4232 domain-containing protein n=1 Tax=Streptomyces glycanivorans TaxID=3033808 RepID=A0ABY9JIA2_9ACTN|nr:DUF4232 domain-containing protein [Streptomyces sp. Alt3]WLQ65776.1 DUF4232 domain-containing protein [Streptomyces sp. Alt3]WSQ79191.1 DUF4232 domain-containing protein [Streptomyces sp. NBC_01213]